MLIQPDLLVRDVLQETLAAVKVDPLLLAEIFEDRPAGEVAEIQAYFATSTMEAQLGWPRAAAELPGIYVLLGSTREGSTPVGLSFPDDETPPTTVVEERGTFFDSTVRCACWALNGDPARKATMERKRTVNLGRISESLSSTSFFARCADVDSRTA